MAGIIPYSYREATLANGLKVIAMPMPGNGLVSFWSIVRTGSRDEYEAGHTGFAHFFEHMMFRGTDRYPADVYQRILTELGADTNAFTTDDLTAFHASVTAGDLPRVMELESDRFQNLSYAEADFQTEAGAVYGEYRKDRTDPAFVLYEALLGEAFRKHTYGHTTMGYERDIAAMPTMYEYSRSFFARYYRPDNTVLFIAGDIEPDGVVQLAERHYGGWRAGYAAPDVPAEPPQTGARRVDVRYEGQTLPTVCVAYKLDRFDPADARRAAADLLAALAFGETSPAYRRLVLNEQVVECLQADVNPNRDPGLFDIYARIKDPDNVDYALDVIEQTAAAQRRSPPKAAELAALKSHFKYAFLMSLQTPDAVAAKLCRYIAISGGLDGVEKLYAAYERLTPDDVQRAAQAYLTPDQRTVGVLRGTP